MHSGFLGRRSATERAEITPQVAHAVNVAYITPVRRTYAALNKTIFQAPAFSLSPAKVAVIFASDHDRAAFPYAGCDMTTGQLAAVPNAAAV